MPSSFPTCSDQLDAAEEIIRKTVAKEGLSDSSRFVLTQFLDIRNHHLIDKLPAMLQRTGMSAKDIKNDIKPFTDALHFRANNEWTPQLVQFLHALNHVRQLPPVTPAPDQDTPPPVSDPLGAYDQCDAYENSSTYAV
jgi:hypothetical protein